VNQTKRRSSVLSGMVALAVLAAACGSSKDSSSDTTAAAGATSGSPTTSVKVSGTLQGSGSTLQAAYQQEALDAFQKAHSGATITYGGGGSGQGRTDLKNKTKDFVGSDAPFADADKPADPILYFPILFSPITVSYNLKGVDKLQLSADTIAKIFQRDVKSWNDPAIAADNPGVTLPSTAITVAHRSDGSGTTQNFTAYLVAAAPNVWKLKSGSTVEWPPDTQAGNGNPGVAQIITGTDGAIGYVDLSDATAANLKWASVKNSAGKFIEPTADSATKAADGVTVKPDLTFTAVNTSAPDGYPITAPSWVIIYAKQSSADKTALVKAYVGYLVGDGQKLLVDLDYAPLSSSLQQKAVAQLDQITGG
jgi:phosphate transport system substrate-binding protein